MQLSDLDNESSVLLSRADLTETENVGVTRQRVDVTG
jgi:hypothetical protein